MDAHPTYTDPRTRDYRTQGRCEECGVRGEVTVHHMAAPVRVNGKLARPPRLHIKEAFRLCDDCTPNR